MGGLVASRPVPSIGEWILCLLLLWDGEGDVGVCGDVCVSDFKSMIRLSRCGGEAASGGGFLDEEKVEECNKQDEGCE